MKRVLALAAAAAALFFAYRWWTDRGASNVYEGFAGAWVRGDKTLAARYGTDAAVKVLDRKALRGTPSGSIMEAFRGERYEVESREHGPDGEIELVVRQTIFFDPPGATTGIGGAMYTHFRHAATVRRTDDGWRVVAFDPTYLDMGETRARR